MDHILQAKHVHKRICGIVTRFARASLYNKVFNHDNFRSMHLWHIGDLLTSAGPPAIRLGRDIWEAFDLQEQGQAGQIWERGE